MLHPGQTLQDGCGLLGVKKPPTALARPVVEERTVLFLRRSVPELPLLPLGLSLLSSIVVAVPAAAPIRDLGDRSEQPVLLIVDTGGKEQRSRWTGVGVVAKSKRPEPVYCDWLAMAGPQQPLKLTADRIKGCDLTAAELADEQFVARLAKTRRRKSESPRSVQPRHMLKSLQQLAARVKHVYIA